MFLLFQTKGPPWYQINGFIDIGEYHKATVNGLTELEGPAEMERNKDID